LNLSERDVGPKSCGVTPHIKETSVTADVIQYCNDAEQKYFIAPVIGGTAQGMLINLSVRRIQRTLKESYKY